MLTFLTVEKPKKRGALFLRNKVYVEEKEAQGIKVKHIRYIQKSKKIRWDKIKKFSLEESGRLLVSEELELPENSGLMRFESSALKERLCLNTATSVLETIKAQRCKVKVAVYDPDGLVVDSAEALLRFADTITIVTRMTGFYSAEAQRIMDERGAVLKVSRSTESLASAQLVVAPQVLIKELPLNKQAVVLTVAKPQVSQKCRVLSGYDFALSEETEALIPRGFDKVYFASALYTLCRRFDLGSVVPRVIEGEGVSYTQESLAKYLINICENT